MKLYKIRYTIDSKARESNTRLEGYVLAEDAAHAIRIVESSGDREVAQFTLLEDTESNVGATIFTPEDEEVPNASKKSR